jgi:hypothetical protein
MNRNLRIIATAVCIMGAVSAAFPGWLQFKPLKKAESSLQKTSVDPKLVFRFFDEDFISGGYPYWYPENSKVFIPEESGKNGEVALEFDLNAGEYSGGSVCLYNMQYDLRPFYSSGALQFWIKGVKGGEIAWAALVDDENSDGKKTVVRLPVNNYGGISKEWKLISIPLADFGKRGVFWDARKRVEIPERFQWDAVCEFRLEIKKNDNESFKAWVDDIFIMKDIYQPKEEKEEIYWDEIKETVPAPPLTSRPEGIKDNAILFENDVPAGGFCYVYGGKTAYKVQPTTSKDNPGVLACYSDNTDYSGVTLALGIGKNIDISPLRKAKSAALAFWAKGAPGVSTIYIGILDNQGGDKKVQTKVMLNDFGKLDTTWKYYMIPLRRFQDVGKYWDAAKKAEVVGDVNWSQVNEIRFSTNKSENKVPAGQPVTLYVDQISFIDAIPGYVDPEDYWNEFKSSAPDVTINNLESEIDKKWEPGVGPKSESTFKIIPSTAKNGGKNAIEISFKMNDWCDMVYQFKTNNSPANIRDWTKHWGIKFDMYTTRGYQPINVQVSDAGDEVWIASAGATKGWNEVLVPFKAFYKFPYWQPETAVQNGKFDLNGVVSIDFKPSGEGTSGSFIIDNIRLTNERDVKVAPVAEKVDVAITGDFNKVITPSINDGIFGINAAVWDGDMFKPKTAEYVKPVNHKIIRYPGGLTGDDYHWKDVLSKKDWQNDCDEFLEFCKQTGSTPMITANFGTGTPEEAAEWVKHYNVDLKANVKYWEIGNELYGNWHANFCTGEFYGKRTVEYIKAMKAVDPTIQIAVVWVIEGDWNKKVFEYVKDYADAVIVHHYPQHTGEENDAGLLSAPQTLNSIVGGVYKQLAAYGTPGKKYQVWLTEWNSVDFKPGPQTLGIVNGLFVADYLGMLATNKVDIANYWDIHNDVTEQGGDYGYLSRTGAPDGDNTTRPSYWAFRMASEAIRGKLVESKAADENLTTYLTENQGKKTLMMINKYPKTKAVVGITIPGFKGKATLKQLRADNSKSGYSSESVVITEGSKITLPVYSITTITLE